MEMLLGVEALFAVLLGLVVGSFLGVVAHRLPLMLERAWADHCAETIGAKAPSRPHYNLFRPPSHCPACKHRLGILENIPLVSWLLQRGHCRACGSFIGWREPLVEVAAAALALLVVWRFGPDWDRAFAAIFVWMLLLAAVIDIQRGWLPDEVTGPMLWIGLVANLGGRFASPEDAVIGAVAGYLSLWLVYWGFRLATGREGMGLGDLHLLAAIGAWTGWQALPGVILLSALLGLLWAAVACLALGRSRAEPMPFGPMLALAGLVALVWPDSLAGLLTGVSPALA
ncbi:MAG: prepilin peptidase [Rhodocyclaceae bacterium]|nr:prepilin peptidase [Rhodocyclaceae bacterium]